MNVAITGSDGKVGQALISQLSPEIFNIKELDLPEYDVGDIDCLIDATRGCDAIIHLAWKDIDVNSVDPLDVVMYENVYRAAIANKVGLVIMGSSNHARNHDEREQDGKIRYSGQVELPNNIYGVEKQKMEAMGRFFADENGLRVVCLRIGNVNPEDRPKSDKPTRWLSHRDLGGLVTKVLQAELEPSHFEVIYGVSKQQVFDWVNTVGYEPQDTAK